MGNFNYVNLVKKDAKRLRILKKVSRLFAYKLKTVYMDYAEKFILSFKNKKYKLIQIPGYHARSFLDGISQGFFNK